MDVSFNLKQNKVMETIGQYAGVDAEDIKKHTDASKKLMPYVNMKVERFSPRISQLVFKDEFGEFDSKGKEFLNSKLMSLENTLEDPNLKMARSMIDNGIPFVPFPRIESCLGMGVNDASV